MVITPPPTPTKLDKIPIKAEPNPRPILFGNDREALGFPIAVAGAIGYISTGYGNSDLPDHTIGYVYLPALIGIVVGTFITVPFGAKLTHSLPVTTLKKIFAIILLGLAVKMFTTIFR